MDNINFVTSQIIRGCQSRSVTVNETLAAFMARARVVESPELYHMDKNLTDDDISELIKECVNRLCARDSPPLQTIRAQVAFEEEYQHSVDTVQRKENTKDAKLNEIFMEIESVRVKSESDFDALSVLYRKIFNYVMVCTGADQASDRAVERENAAALESVFPRVALSSFVALGTADKRVQLHELSNIVYGIRLFNKEIGKGGAGIVDVNSTLDAEMDALSNVVSKQIGEVEVVLEQYVDVLCYLQHPSRRDESRNSTLARRLHTELVFWRQFQAFQEQLIDETSIVGEHVRSTREAFSVDMSELKDIVGGLTSVPKEKVYPRFDALASMWMIFVDESQKLALLKSVLGKLDGFREMPFKPAMRVRDVEAARAAAPPAAEGVTAVGADGTEEPEGETVVVPSHLLPQVRLEFRGFDAFAIAERDGLLVPGKPNYGGVRHKGKYYAFSEASAVGSFLADPDKVISAVADAARATPEIIHLLGLGSSFPSVAIRHMVAQGIDMGDGSLLYRGGIDNSASKEMGCQTDTHVVQSYIDKNYEWNEWALRKRALMLTNLRTKLTHSTQTNDSHFRRDNASQHYPPKENKTQTAKSTGTAPRKESNFITGLRGHPDEKMHVVNISLDL